MKKIFYTKSLLIVFLIFSCQKENFNSITDNENLSFTTSNKTFDVTTDCSEINYRYDFNKPIFNVESREDLLWGINGHSLRKDGVVNNPYDGDISYEETVGLLKKLNIKVYRNDIHVNDSGNLFYERDEDLNDLLTILEENKIEFVPMIYSSDYKELLNDSNGFNYASLKSLIRSRDKEFVNATISFTDLWKNNYKYGYDLGKNFAKKRGDKIKYYNVSNEVAYRIISQLEHPNNINDENNSQFFYNEVGYGDSIYDFFTSEVHAKHTVASSALIKGVIDGIHQEDDDAICFISETRGNIGYLEFFNIMKVEYDAIGWNWYSSFGDITKVKSGNEIHGLTTNWNIYKKLNTVSGNKPLWITEINRTFGSSVNQEFDDQSIYIRKSMEEVYQLPNIKAYVIYELLDGSNGTTEKEDYFGLVTNPILSEIELKPSFNSYKFSIEELNYGYHDFMFSYYKLYKNNSLDLVNHEGINYWASQFKSGLKISEFLELYMEVDASNFINEQYQLLLNRDVDTSGKEYYLSKLQEGLNREWLIADIISSESFFNSSQNSNYNRSSENENFIYHLYHKLLNRNPTNNELNQVLNSRDNRRSYASSVLNSEEYTRVFITNQYNHFLERNPDNPGLEYHLSIWNDQKTFLIKIMTSDEFWRKSVMRAYCERY